MQSQRPCSRCGGRGKIIKTPCRKCSGTGRVQSSKRLEVTIPAGIDDDQSLAMRGLGDKGANGGPAGDVIIIVTVRPDTLFERDKYDVWVTVPITFSQAVNGDEVVVPTIDGKVEYKVPEAPRAARYSGCGARASSTSTARDAATSMSRSMSRSPSG